MRELDTDASPPPDLEVLLDRIQQLRRFVPDVARVEAALIADDLAERGKLVGRPKGARRIDEPGRETDRPFVHGLREKGSHLGELILRGSAIVGAHDTRTQRPVPDEGADVYRRPHMVDGIRVLAERSPRPLHVEAT